MHIKQIKIGNYKSLKQSQNIDLSSQLITFIGKNGSGKTNVLDALFSLFDSRAANERKGMDFRFFIELTSDDLSIFKDVLKIDESEKIIEAYYSEGKNGLGININRIKSPLLNDLMHTTEESIYSIAKELKKEMNSYKSLINDLAEESYQYKKLTINVIFGVDDVSNSTNYGYIFTKASQELDDLINKVSELINDRKKGDELILSFQYITNHLYLHHISDFKLQYTRPKLTKFEQKHITIDEDAIKKEITKINRKSVHQINKIKTLSDKLKIKFEALSSIMDEHIIKEQQEDTNFDRVLSRIISVCNPKIYYLRNENNQLFFRKDRAFNAYHTVDERTILDTFIKYRYKTQKISDIRKKLDENNLSTKEIEELSVDLESYINEHLPTFEKDMIQKVKVSKDLSFSIVEKTGDEIPFSFTNSGRRWFFTYFFVKGCLLPGDILMMDEPANHMHPEAQVFIRNDIEELSKTNKVILTTHSPYMISKNSFLYYVEMTKEGTSLISKDNTGIHEIAKSLGSYNDDTIIGDILINNRLLPFDEIGRRIKVKTKEKGYTQRSIADKLGCDEREIRNKFKGVHLTYHDIIWFCANYELNPVDIILSEKIG